MDTTRVLTALSLREGIFETLTEATRKDLGSYFEYPYPDGITKIIDVHKLNRQMLRSRIQISFPWHVFGNEISYQTNTRALYQNIETEATRLERTDDITIQINMIVFPEETVHLDQNVQVDLFAYMNGKIYTIPRYVNTEEFDVISSSIFNGRIFVTSEKNLYELIGDTLRFIDFVAKDSNVVACQDRLYLFPAKNTLVCSYVTMYVFESGKWKKSLIEYDFDGVYSVNRDNNIINVRRNQVFILTIDFKHIIKHYSISGYGELQLKGVSEENKIVLWSSDSRNIVII